MKSKKIIVMFFIMVLALSSTVFGANSMKYYLDGGLEYVTTENVELKYYLNGNIESITVGEDIEITNYLAGNLSMVKTASGEITFMLSGDVNLVNGNYVTIAQEALAALQSATAELGEYINSIQIKVPGATSPSDSINVIVESFNEIINQLNDANGYTASTPTGNGTAGTLSGVNQDINLSGATINGGPQGVTIGTINGSVAADPNSASISMPGASVSANSESASIDMFGMSVTADGNGVSMNLPGMSVTAGVDGTNVNMTSSNNNVQLYIIIGLIFFVLFIVIVFGFIMIKKQKGQIVTKQD